ncbi:unnamed protein product [Prorocentrum cordatum]|uniref:Uncharacterized protein n=1 Tax=Prorocentrum cordatum TaxID=2364126 RepID=A0ABN9YM14_9DINO|nr:unnamed protein product [Polarella glacialis]
MVYLTGLTAPEAAAGRWAWLLAPPRVGAAVAPWWCAGISEEGQPETAHPSDGGDSAESADAIQAAGGVARGRGRRKRGNGRAACSSSCARTAAGSAGSSEGCFDGAAGGAREPPLRHRRRALDRAWADTDDGVDGDLRVPAPPRASSAAKSQTAMLRRTLAAGSGCWRQRGSGGGRGGDLAAGAAQAQAAALPEGALGGARVPGAGGAAAGVAPLRQAHPAAAVLWLPAGAPQTPQLRSAAPRLRRLAFGVPGLLVSSACLGLCAVLLGGAHAALCGLAAEGALGAVAGALVRLPITLHFGWISCAALVNLNNWMANSGSGLRAKLVLAYGSVAAAVAAAGCVSAARRDPVYPLVVAWSLTAVYRFSARDGSPGPLRAAELGGAAAAACMVVACCVWGA